MTNILILGANGQIARVATELFLEHTAARLTLYLRNACRLKISDHADQVRVVEGDVLDSKALEAAMSGLRADADGFASAVGTHPQIETEIHRRISVSTVTAVAAIFYQDQENASDIPLPARHLCQPAAPRWRAA